jgi:hypothetical protein
MLVDTSRPRVRRKQVSTQNPLRYLRKADAEELFPELLDARIYSRYRPGTHVQSRARLAAELRELRSRLPEIHFPTEQYPVQVYDVPGPTRRLDPDGPEGSYRDTNSVPTLDVMTEYVDALQRLVVRRRSTFGGRRFDPTAPPAHYRPVQI